MLINALKNVNPIYFGECVHQASNIDDDSVFQYAERVFSYELYHQIRKLMGDNCDYYLNAEIQKDNKLFQCEIKNNCYPDLVLHKNPYFLEDGQYFLCEIKTACNKKLLSDLDKLTYFCNSNLGFNEYVFLCLGISRDELKYELNKNKSHKPYDDKILCICRKSNYIYVFRLGAIIAHNE